MEVRRLDLRAVVELVADLVGRPRLRLHLELRLGLAGVVLGGLLRRTCAPRRPLPRRECRSARRTCRPPRARWRIFRHSRYRTRIAPGNLPPRRREMQGVRCSRGASAHRSSSRSISSRGRPERGCPATRARMGSVELRKPRVGGRRRRVRLRGGRGRCGRDHRVPAPRRCWRAVAVALRLRRPSLAPAGRTRVRSDPLRDARSDGALVALDAAPLSVYVLAVLVAVARPVFRSAQAALTPSVARPDARRAHGRERRRERGRRASACSWARRSGRSCSSSRGADGVRGRPACCCSCRSHSSPGSASRASCPRSRPSRARRRSSPAGRRSSPSRTPGRHRALLRADTGRGARAGARRRPGDRDALARDGRGRLAERDDRSRRDARRARRRRSRRAKVDLRRTSRRALAVGHPAPAGRGLARARGCVPPARRARRREHPCRRHGITSCSEPPRTRCSAASSGPSRRSRCSPGIGALLAPVLVSVLQARGPCSSRG